MVSWIDDVLVRRLHDAHPSVPLPQQLPLMDPAVSATLRRFVRAHPKPFQAVLDG